MRGFVMVLVACGSSAPVATSPAQVSPNPPVASSPAQAKSWLVPSGWRAEVIPFPLDFAPSLPHKGVEVIRFAPGFFDPHSPGYWSYVFAWRLDDTAELDAQALGRELTTYFAGLVAAVDGKHRISDDDRRTITARVLEPRTKGNFSLTVESFDPFGDGRPIKLTGVATRSACGSGALWVFRIQPNAPVNYELEEALGNVEVGADCDNVHR
jgi:hypothetical protein